MNPDKQLTPKEMEVLNELISGGPTNAEIGKRLYMSKSSVDGHMEAVFRKTGIHNRVGLALAWYKWVHEDEEIK